MGLTPPATSSPPLRRGLPHPALCSCPHPEPLTPPARRAEASTAVGAAFPASAARLNPAPRQRHYGLQHPSVPGSLRRAGASCPSAGWAALGPDETPQTLTHEGGSEDAAPEARQAAGKALGAHLHRRPPQARPGPARRACVPGAALRGGPDPRQRVGKGAPRELRAGPERREPRTGRFGWKVERLRSRPAQPVLIGERICRKYRSHGGPHCYEPTTR